MTRPPVLDALSIGVGREVGIAGLDKDTGRAILLQVCDFAPYTLSTNDESICQISDCQTYMKTLQHVHLMLPSTILVLDSSLPSETSHQNRSPTVLVQCIQDEFPEIALQPVSRKYWNDTSGEIDLKM